MVKGKYTITYNTILCFSVFLIHRPIQIEIFFVFHRPYKARISNILHGSNRDSDIMVWNKQKISPPLSLSMGEWFNKQSDVCVWPYNTGTRE